MLDLESLAKTLQNALRITGAPAAAEPGQPLSLGLTPDIDILSVCEMVKSLLDLDAVSKQVTFGNPADPQPPLTADELFDDQTIASVQRPLSQLSTGLLTLAQSGVAGSLGQIRLPPIELPKVSVKWRVYNEDGVEQTDADNEVYLAPDGLEKLVLNLLLLPKFAPMSLHLPRPVKRTIAVSVTLALGTDSKTIEVPAITLLMPVIPVPRVLVLMQHHRFTGSTLVLVPRDSLLNSIEALQPQLETLRSVLRLVSVVGKLAEMLSGIDLLAKVLTTPSIAFAVGGSFHDLNNYDFASGFWNDQEVEDNVTSFIYLAPPAEKGVDSDDHNKVAMMVRDSLKKDEGWFEVETGPGFIAACADLRVVDNIPPTVGTTIGLAFGTLVVKKLSDEGRFNDEISSIDFL